VGSIIAESAMEQRVAKSFVVGGIAESAMEQRVAKSFVVGGIAESAMGRRIAAKSACGEKRNEVTMGRGFAESAVGRSEYSVKIFRGSHTLPTKVCESHAVKQSAERGPYKSAARDMHYELTATEEIKVVNEVWDHTHEGNHPLHALGTWDQARGEQVVNKAWDLRSLGSSLGSEELGNVEAWDLRSLGSSLGSEELQIKPNNKGNHPLHAPGTWDQARGGHVVIKVWDHTILGIKNNIDGEKYPRPTSWGEVSKTHFMGEKYPTQLHSRSFMV